jgi:hypothetical protein
MNVGPEDGLWEAVMLSGFLTVIGYLAAQVPSETLTTTSSLVTLASSPLMTTLSPFVAPTIDANFAPSTTSQVNLAPAAAPVAASVMFGAGNVPQDVASLGTYAAQ